MRVVAVTKRQTTGVDSKDETAVGLLHSLADELKLPLLQIARQAEMENRPAIEYTATKALQLIDAYTLVTTVTTQGQLDLSPVPLSALLYDVAQESSELARQYDSQIEIRIQGSFGQVMAHQQALRTALTSLAYTLITGGLKGKQQRITLIAKARSDGIQTGVISNYAQLSSDDLQQIRALFGKALRPAGAVTQNSGVGLYLADHLFDAMEAPLKVIKYGHHSGLAATLTPSQQLALL